MGRCGHGRTRSRPGAWRLADRRPLAGAMSSTSTCQSASFAFFGMMTFLPDTPRNAAAKLDWFGFGTLSLAIAAMQVLVDRGEELDWFGSGEIVAEAIIAVSAFYLFLVHTFTAREPFVRLVAVSRCNFTAGVLFISIVGLTYYASLALQPPYLQNLMNYPIVSAGLVLGPRGVGTMGSMLIVGRLIGRCRYAISSGLGARAHGLVVLCDDRLDAGRVADDDCRRRDHPGHWPRLYLCAVERGRPYRRWRRNSGRRAPAFTACRAISAPASVFPS